MLTQPALLEKDLQTERGVILEELHMYEDSPEDLCADNLYAGVWQGDMLGSNILGERKTVSSLTVDDLRAHMRRYYTSERMVAAVCGRFDREEIVRLCEKFFGPMTNSGNPVQASPAQYRKCLTLRKKDFEQTQLALAMPGIGAQDDRRFAMRLLMSVLGTSSSSRLYQRIREELGLVYEIESFSASYLEAGILGVDMALSPRNEKKGAAGGFPYYRRFCRVAHAARTCPCQGAISLRAHYEYGVNTVPRRPDGPRRAAL